MTERRIRGFSFLQRAFRPRVQLPAALSFGRQRFIVTAVEWAGSAVTRIGQREIGIALLALLVWLANLRLPADIVSPTLDSSWNGALGVALHSRMQSGADLVFTYGPLGYMCSGSYDPDLFAIRVLAWEAGFGLLVAMLLIRVLLRIRGILERTLAFLLIVVLPTSSFPYELIALAAAAVLLLDRPGRRPTGILWMTLVLAALSLVKFTLCMASLGCVAAVTAGRWIEGERRIALGVGAAWCGWFLLLWTLCGQSVANLPSYFRLSALIASGYEEGMSTLGGTSILRLGLLGLAGFVILFLLLVVAYRPRATLVATGACLLLGTFVAFKSGFVRASDHTPLFFKWGAIAGFLFPTPEEMPSWRRNAATLTRLCLAVLGVVGTVGSRDSSPYRASAIVPECGRRLYSNGLGLLDLGGFQAQRDSELRQNQRKHALPRTLEKVGDEPIDMLSYEQGYLFLNGMRWRPRPVFQSYCALDPDLLTLNANFLEGEDAPPYLLFRLQTIDNRLPTMDDGLALQVLARDWRPVLVERGMLLLQRAPRDESTDPPRIVLEKSVGFGERVALPRDGGACHVLSLDIRYSLLGRLVKSLFRAPPISLCVENDADETSEARIVPGMMRTGAIIDPWLHSQQQWIDWTTGRLVHRTIAVTVLEPKYPRLYATSIDLRITARNAIAPVVVPDLDRPPPMPLFRTQPAAIDSASPPSSEQVDGEEVLVTHAPSDIRFELLAGEHIVRGRYGMLPKAWLAEKTDGATFCLLLEEENGARRLLLNLRLDPRNDPADRVSRDFEVSFESRAGAQLHLITRPGPSGDDAGDWTYWGSIEVEGASIR
jgi:hypothetical protein